MDQQAQQQRPRSKSTFSFKSQNSHSSDPNRHDRRTSTSGHQRKESDSYKPHLTTTGKADPNAAMNESQPSTLPESLLFLSSLCLPMFPSRRCAREAYPAVSPLVPTHRQGWSSYWYVHIWHYCPDELWANDPQRNLTSPTPHAHGGSAPSILSDHLKPLSIVNTDGERTPCAVRCSIPILFFPTDPLQTRRPK